MSFTHQNQIRSKLKKAFLVLIGIYAILLVMLYAFQESMLFMPTRLEKDYVYTFDNDFEELFLETNDKAILNGLHFKVENPYGVILYFHGNAGNLQRWGQIVTYFVEKQFDVVVMDYRTYGKSTGRLDEVALYKDGQLFYDYVASSYSKDSITIYGRSLGSGIASYVASKNISKQLILETPFYSIEDVARYRFPIFPVTKLLKYRFPNNQHLKDVECPISIIHGTEDLVVPYKSGKKLVDEHSQGSIKLYTINGGHHNDLVNFDAFHKAIDEILE